MRDILLGLPVLLLACGGSSGENPGNPDSGFIPGAAISATPNTWTWVPFPNSACGDGSPVGIGVNPSTTGSRVLIYLEGGGACWDNTTCFTLQTASSFTHGYSEADFDDERADVSYLAAPNGFFDRTSAANPFKDYNYVYVPYCTGDLHAGNNVMTFSSGLASFTGYTNFTAFLERIVPTFPSAERVVLAGSSSGGDGALYNWGQTASAFAGTRVDMIDDSGTFMPADVDTMMMDSTWRSAWRLTTTLPAACTACASNLAALYGFYAQAHPQSRGALLSYTMDSVVPSEYGITTSAFTTGLDEDLTASFAPNANLKSFLVGQTGHVLWFNPTLTAGSTQVIQFVNLMETDDAAWASVGP